MHYTHATATFSASLLLRLARLFPDQCVTEEVRTQVEKLAGLLSEIPGKRYAVTLQLMLKRARKRNRVSRSPTFPRENRHHRTNSMEYASGDNGAGGNAPPDKQGQGATPSSQEPISPAYDINNHATMPGQMHVAHDQHGNVTFAPNVGDIWRGFESTSNEQLPVWLSDQTLGGNSFQQNGMDAFFLPHEFFPPAPQIW